MGAFHWNVATITNTVCHWQVRQSRTSWRSDTAILRTGLVKRVVACISRTNVSHFHVVLEGLSLAVHSASLRLPCS